ncbi:glycoside hydrolase family 16 protein [Kitasatospora sp. CM 4170]|uniref:Glycoside hydrolase family 16 protein n=1 Tax=Kitasatospora aburaviensis TaxID=67265 RepID=A0ABW1ENW8_9ACTN|nr:glycoside hydrolase family 16 protein [Kitasatospora sp. CM 4170]WNM48724.1 glycoside hydrolase family 16 protein [Kitasatospora sp. CM 4170]
MTVRPWTLPRALPALCGWIALAAQLLPAGNPLRAVAAGIFLLAGPGAAAVAWARPGPSWRDRGPGRVSAAALTVTVSLALTMLTAEALFFTHNFTVGRAVLALAVLTTLLTVLPRRFPAAPAPAPAPVSSPDPASGEPARRPRRARRVRRASVRPSVRPKVRWRLVSVVGVLLLAAACGTVNGAGVGAAALHPPTTTAAAGDADVPPPVGADQPPGVGPWHEAFRDDFNGTGLDGSKWTTCYDWNVRGCTNAGNHEDQWYLPGQVSVGDGTLTLTAQRQATTGSDGKTYPWTSGMVSTGRDTWDGTPRHTFTYGYFAAAIRTTDQPLGMFPAFWLLSANTRGGLPELDIAEFINSNQYVDLNLHAEAPDGTDIDAHYAHGPADFAVGYHVLGLDWEPDAVTWYVDGVQVFQVTDPTSIPTTPMELILNLAVGYQQSPPPGVDKTQVKVDWVAVWQH